jgi:hypothetical protein
MSGWGDKEFQNARIDQSLVKHEVQVQFDKALLAVSQYYSTKTKQVQCCIVPNEVISLDRSPSIHIEIDPGECILVWPDQHADVYDSTYMTFKKKLGKYSFAAWIWQQLWSFHDGDDVDIEKDLDKLKQATHGH